MKHHRFFGLIITFLFLNACATYKPQYKDENFAKPFPKDKQITHSFYLIGDGGNSPIGTQTEALKDFKAELSKASTKSTALFLGDNIYPSGMPKKGHEQRAFAEHQLNIQAQAVKDFKGQTIFVPGNHDWYSNGLKGLKRQENYIEDILGKNTFLPEKGCPIKKVNITEDIVLIVIDSQWYLTNWDKHPTINDDCEIKTRAMFFEEFESLIKKARGRTTIIAMHHPMFTNGPHGGQYSFGQHMSPIPVLGTLKNVIRKTSGITNTDLQNSKYRELKKRLVTLTQENDKAIFVSGHEHSLQYIVEDNIPQIVSGAGSKTNPTRNVGGGQFSYGASGYARLDVFKDGTSFVRFYEAETDKVIFQTEVISGDNKEESVNYDSSFPKEKSASIYSNEETTKGNFYKKLWGERYRDAFSTNVMAPTVNLDTLLGGLAPVRKGGGHQSKSLRLEDKDGREYVMRALRKNAVQYLQAVAFKDQYIEGKFNDTYTEGLLLDVFTGSHPYAPFTIATLSKAIGVYHTNPVLYYVPKQNALGQFNAEFGDELYMIEERPADGHGNNSSFGFSNKIISTNDMLAKLRKNENHKVDEAAYIRARLFDMLIGDWDRHEDQWRWAIFKEKDKTIYKPVPRDRDQAFSIMADGALLGFATKIVPSLRSMKSYDEELKSPKWFNLSPYPLDMALIKEANRLVWNNQVKHIVSNLSNEVIDEAFTYFPKEVNNETILDIKRKLIGRRANLQKISDEYYNHINKFAVIKGTDKDDWFVIERMLNGENKVTAYRIKKGEKGEIFHQRTYTSNDTKEIWIYGLDDKDTFQVFGNGDKLISIRLIGGQNNDTYNIKNGKRVNIYDFKSKKSEFVTNKGKVKLTDDYETNVYDYKKLKNSANQLIPTLGANPDDGFKIGIVNTFTNYDFERNPFTSQHTFSASYYFATNGFDFKYSAEFANIIGRWNLGIEAIFTSPNYSINFFGFGNETINLNEIDEDNYNLDYNRVKLSALKFSPSLIWKGELGANFKIGLSYESIEVEETTGLFINTFLGVNDIENRNNFFVIEASYSYKNTDNKAFPTLGFQTSLQLGYKTNVKDSKGFGYIIPSIGFNYKLVSNGQLVLATKLKAHINLGDDFEFYQAASIGANDGLRGYRNQRFSGKSAFYQSTDLRLNLRKVKTGILPLNIGIFGGVDYGRVWVDGEDSDKWNNSFGGGIFANMVDMMSFNLSAFNSDDGLRLAFKFGFGF
ncbi:metallophosphoesterase [Olleya sp. AH-315-F22]|nr:metallophosphoesterase [Olleya sp. AH-315-F22]